MRIAVVNPYFPPEPPGGIEKEIINIANEWCEMGDAVRVVATDCAWPTGTVGGDERPPDLEPDIEVVRLRGYFRTKLREFQPSRAPVLVPRLTSAVLAHRPDGVVVFNSGWPATMWLPLLRLRRKTAVVYQTAYHPPAGQHLLDPWRRLVLLRVAGLAHRLVPHSHLEKGQLMRDGNIPEHKIAVIPAGVSWQEFTETQVGRFRNQHGLANRVVIVHVARLSTFKGSDRLIRVLPKLLQRTGPPRRTGRDIALLMVGENMEERRLAELIGQMGVADRVVLLGRVTEEQLRLAYAASDIFALPSQYESFGFVFLEAMAQGLPVVGVDTGGVSEIVRHGQDGFLMSRAENLEELEHYLAMLVGSAELRRQMGEAARREVRAKYSWRRCAEEYRALIAGLVEARAAALTGRGSR